MMHRKTLLTCALFLTVLGSGTVWATPSYANTHLGLSVSGYAVLGDTRGIGVGYGFPIALEGGRYLDSGFEAFIRFALSFVYQQTGVLPNGGGGTVVGLGGNLGVRYLFLEESIRPYVFLQVSAMGFLRPKDTNGAVIGGYNEAFVGPGGGLGVDFFVSESVALGLRGFVDVFITLNAPTSFAPGGSVYASVYF